MTTAWETQEAYDTLLYSNEQAEEMSQANTTEWHNKCTEQLRREAIYECRWKLHFQPHVAILRGLTRESIQAWTVC